MGVAWLAIIGAHVMDYRILSLQFFLVVKFVALCGEKNQGPQSTSVNQLLRLNLVKSIAECYQMIIE